MITSPCKDCTARYLGCHDTCKHYKQYKIDMEVWNKSRQFDPNRIDAELERLHKHRACTRKERRYNR